MSHVRSLILIQSPNLSQPKLVPRKGARFEAPEETEIMTIYGVGMIGWFNVRQHNNAIQMQLPGRVIGSRLKMAYKNTVVSRAFTNNIRGGYTVSRHLLSVKHFENKQNELN